MLNSAHLTERLSFQFTIFIAQLLKQGEKQAENQPSDKHYSSFRGAEALLFPHGTLEPSQEWVWFCYFFFPSNAHLYAAEEEKHNFMYESNCFISANLLLQE